MERREAMLLFAKLRRRGYLPELQYDDWRNEWRVLLQRTGRGGADADLRQRRIIAQEMSSKFTIVTTVMPTYLKVYWIAFTRRQSGFVAMVTLLLRLPWSPKTPPSGRAPRRARRWGRRLRLRRRRSIRSLASIMRASPFRGGIRKRQLG
jgi:hypothetical protein